MGTALTERQAARRARVIEAAMRLAADGGYEAVQMRDVAAEARVALGTLYRYFSSKDQLLVAVMGEWILELQARLRQRPPEGATPADRVMDVLRRATRALERAPRVTGAVVTALSSLSGEDPAGLRQSHEVYKMVAETITLAMDGERRDRDAVVRVLGQVWFANLIEWVRGWIDSKQMLQDLESAVRLILGDAPSAKKRSLSRARG